MKNKLNIIQLVRYVLPFIVFASCSKPSIPGPPVTEEISDPLGITVSSDFNFQTIATSTLDITLLTNDDKPLAGIMVNILDKSPDDGGVVIYTSVSDINGKVSGDLKLPTYLQSVVVDPAYIGLMHNASVKINDNRVSCTIGGSDGYKGDVITNGRMAVPYGAPNSNERIAGEAYSYIGTYGTSGKPNYLMPVNDVISAKTLGYINASLPESKPVPTYHPDFLKENISTNLEIVQKSDVWITFVHEGAGYQNALSYFTFPTGKTPTSVKDIDSLRIILPNASFSGSGGALSSGNKVKIGTFEPGITIGFCLIANGWSDVTKVVGSGLNKFYSIDALNPEPAGLKRHTVLLNDQEDNLVVAGFEDQNRNGYSDNDFNDLIFYASSNPIAGIAKNNIVAIEKPGDSDKDGVADVYDKFPNDPLRAYTSTYPSTGGYASIAFEDNWPNIGDYDMNDLVVDYQYNSIQNAQNKTVELYANYVCKASGAVFKNGFGVQFPFAPSLVSSVTGSRVKEKDVVSLSSNGCEAGQSKAVIIAFDDIYALMPPSKNDFINTQIGAPYIKPDTIKMLVSFASPLTAAQLGTAPFNQFAILDKTRGKEVHLPGEYPTDKVNTALFNTKMDNSIPSQLRYYKTKKNLPFAISTPNKFDYPFEGRMISSAYLKFVSWAQSGGSSDKGWYIDETGSRSKGFIYK